MKKAKCVLVLQGHPDPAGKHLCHCLAERYADGARAAGFDVRELSVAEMDFAVLRSKHDFDTAPLPASLSDARDAVLAADHILLVFPLWLGTIPALLKAFFEQLFRPGVAFVLDNQGLQRDVLPAARRTSSSPWECRPGSID
jgi:putative NADPH-quinone reductase